MSKLVARFQLLDWHNWQHFKPPVLTTAVDDAWRLAMAACHPDGWRLGLKLITSFTIEE